MITANDGISIALLISVVSLVCTLVNTFGGSRKRFQEANEAENKRQLEIEKQFVKINVKLDDFCDTTKQMMKQSEKENERAQELSKQMIQASEQIKTLFNTTKDHEKRLNDLEVKVK